MEDALKGSSMKHTKKTVFLTGGSGLLGQALLDSRRDEDIVALHHRTPIAHASVRVVQGDVRKPLLGMTTSEYARIVDSIDVIIHSAAITRFSARSQEILDTNLEGTREVVKLAERAGARLIYLSTAFVHQQASALEPVSAYEDSKRTAEAIVRELGSRAIIVRPSIIIGDSQTGHIATYQGLHTALGSVVEHALPVLPATPGMLCDFVAQDWVSGAIWGAVHHPAPAAELWVTSGTHALTVAASVAIALDIGERYGFSGEAPRFVPYETLQRLFIPVFLETFPGPMKRRFEAHLKLARYMNQVAPLPSSERYLETTFGLPPREMPETVLRRNMEQWTRRRLQNARQQYGKVTQVPGAVYTASGVA
jgi:thioester reductase-like protein